MTTNHRLRIATIFVICLSLVAPATVPATDVAKLAEALPVEVPAESRTDPADSGTRGRHHDHWKGSKTPAKWNQPGQSGSNGQGAGNPGAGNGSDSDDGGSEPTTPTEPTEPTEPSEPTDPTEPTEPTEPSEPTDPEPGDVDETPTPGGETPAPDPNVSTPAPAPDAGVAPAPAQPDSGATPAPKDEGTDTGGDSGARERASEEPTDGLFITPPENPPAELQAQIDSTGSAISAPRGSRVGNGLREANVPVGAETLVVTEIVQQVPDWVGFSMAALGLTALLSLAIFIRERRRRHTAEVDAMVDSLTGISNRKAFDRRLDLEYRRASRYGRSLGLMVMDLDGFKAVNDLKGHAAGDEVLREVAQRLDGRMRDTDLVARIGGDEFAVICPETGINELMSIRNQLAEQATRGVREPVGLSIGVAEFVPGDHDSASILARADESMYRVKRGERVEALV